MTDPDSFSQRDIPTDFASELTERGLGDARLWFARHDGEIHIAHVLASPDRPVRAGERLCTDPARVAFIVFHVKAREVDGGKAFCDACGDHNGPLN